MHSQLKPYSVVQGKSATNWWHQLDKLEKIAAIRTDRSLTSEEMNNISVIRSQAASWITCACGNQCSILPRDQVGAPEDKELASLGLDFYRQVNAWDAPTARLTLEKIEKRSAYLIAQMNETSNNKQSGVD
jgi:hypothetical protein